MNTLFDKIWDKHVVQIVEDGPTQLYIDRLYCHEVTSPQAFDGMRARGIKCFRPSQIFCMPDHNTPTHDQDKEIHTNKKHRRYDDRQRDQCPPGPAGDLTMLTHLPFVYITCIVRCFEIRVIPSVWLRITSPPHLRRSFAIRRLPGYIMTKRLHHLL